MWDEKLHQAAGSGTTKWDVQPSIRPALACGMDLSICDASATLSCHRQHLGFTVSGWSKEVSTTLTKGLSRLLREGLLSLLGLHVDAAGLTLKQLQGCSMHRRHVAGKLQLCTSRCCHPIPLHDCLYLGLQDQTMRQPSDTVLAWVMKTTRLCDLQDTLFMMSSFRLLPAHAKDLATPCRMI